MVDYRKSSLIIAAALITAASAQLNFKIGPIPYTMQNFGVMFSGFLLGAKFGAAAMLLYLALISIGLPFSAGGGGLGVLLGPTAGFLYGFVISSAIAGFFRKIIWKTGSSKEVVVLWLSTLVAAIPTYLLGFAVFYSFAMKNKDYLAFAEKVTEFLGLNFGSPLATVFVATVLIFVPQDFFVDHLLAVLVFKYVDEMMKQRGVEL